MTINEFRAWLEGFEHSFSENGPDDEQWKEIKRKIEEIEPRQSPKSPSTGSPFWGGLTFRNDDDNVLLSNLVSDKWVI